LDARFTLLAHDARTDGQIPESWVSPTTASAPMKGRGSGPMRLPKLTRIGRDEAGIAIVEVLVSALVLVIFSVGVVTVLTGSTKATAQERHRTQANMLAEQEIERVRSFRIADLVSLNSTRYVLDDGTQLATGCPTSGSQASKTCYTITARSLFQNEPAATSGCSAGSGSRDYMLVTVSVGWSNMAPLHPVTAATIVSPPSGSLVPNSGSILVNVVDSRNVGMPSVLLTGSGPSSFTGSTGPTGCVLWRNVPVGNYTMSVGGAASGMVDQDGNSPRNQTVSVVDQGTNTVNLQYDRPGSIQNVNFRTRDYSNNLVASSADSVIVSNTGMQVAKQFTPPGGTRAASISTTATLFPFTSPYAVYAGSCASDLPPAGPMLGNSTVPVGGAGSLASPGYIQLPSLQVTVWSGSSALFPGSRLSAAKVTAKDTGCNVTRTLTTSTNSSGQVPVAGDIGLPYGTYSVCAQNSAGTDRRIVTVNLNSVGTSGTPVDIYLSGQPSGTCP
jgi:Tfp pilus assembly protein PilV